MFSCDMLLAFVGIGRQFGVCLLPSGDPSFRSGVDAVWITVHPILRLSRGVGETDKRTTLFKSGCRDSHAN
jgi:hypothetical protein